MFLTSPVGTDSLDQNTAYLSTGLHQTLSDKLEILLSRVSATTALSQTYLTSTSDLKESLSTSSYLLSGFGEELEGFRRLVGEKQVKVLALWKQWKECVDEIRQLGIGETALAEARKDGGTRGTSAVNGHGAATGGDAEFEKLIERIGVVGSTWVKKMGESEKVSALPCPPAYFNSHDDWDGGHFRNSLPGFADPNASISRKSQMRNSSKGNWQHQPCLRDSQSAQSWASAVFAQKRVIGRIFCKGCSRTYWITP